MVRPAPRVRGRVAGHGFGVRSIAIDSLLVLLTHPLSLRGGSVQVKRVDHVFDNRTNEWTYKTTKPPAAPRVLAGGKTTDGGDVWQSFCFVVVRHVTENPFEPRVSLTIKSPYLRTACKEIIGERPGVSWTADPLEVGRVVICCQLSLTGVFTNG